MNVMAVDKYLSFYILMAVATVTLLVTPFNTLDPVNLPKLSLLTLTAFLLAGLVASKSNFLLGKSHKWLKVIVGAFIFQMLLALFVDGSDFSFKFYGTPNRNTGFIAYLSLCILLVATSAIASPKFAKKFVWVLIGVSAISAIYGALQSKGYDFYSFDNAYGSNVFGTFGNPNFQSAFMGIAGATALTLIFFSKLKLNYRAALAVLAALAIYNIAMSSQQGFFNLLVGISSAAIIFFFQKRKFKFGWAALGVFLIGVFNIILGLFNIGFFAKILFKSSLEARGNYWDAAIRMMIDNPFFGVGLDGFGGWYRRSRTPEVAASNSSIVSDTAHSIPLDIGSSGGIPLLVLYLLLVGSAFFAIVKVVKRDIELDFYFLAIVAAWVAYQAQSLISINQLGLGVWGWSLTGLLIGYELNTRKPTVVAGSATRHKTRVSPEKMQPSAVVITFISVGIGLLLALPPYIAANKYFSALKSGDAISIYQSAYLQPYDRSRFLNTAHILIENKFDTQAIKVLRDASVRYPDSFDIWSKWSRIPSVSEADIAHAKAEMKRLDPYNPDLK